MPPTKRPGMSNLTPAKRLNINITPARTSQIESPQSSRSMPGPNVVKSEDIVEDPVTPISCPLVVEDPVTPISYPLVTACTLKEKFSQIFNKEHFSDIWFAVGQEPNFQRIPAHKVILSVGSAVFASLFATTQVSRTNEIEVPDIDPDTFLKMLRFLYMEEFLVTAESVESLLYAAHKYSIYPLEEECITFLYCDCNAANVLSTLKLAKTYSAEVLMEKCHQTIKRDTVDVINSDQFLNTDKETLSYILEQDRLAVREIQLFRAVKRWSIAECARRGLEDNCGNMQSILKEILPLLRIHTMTVEEFSNEVAKSGLLLQEDVINFFHYFTARPRPVPPIPFRFNSDASTSPSCSKSNNHSWKSSLNGK